MKTLFMLGILLLSPFVIAAEPEWKPLFNGKDLTGWTANENKKSCKVEDGKIVLFGPRSHLYYTGKVNGGAFKDFELKLEIMTMKGSNSGVYFHTKFQERGWPSTG